MKKHHWYVTIGGILATVAPIGALVVPFVGQLHGAGVGVAVAGLIDWWFTSAVKDTRWPN